MDLNWLQSIAYGFLSGLTDILPVSASAHKVLLLKFFGIKSGMEMMDLMIHLGILGGLYFCNQSQFVRFSRARALAKIPKRRRKRPLDTRTLMDISMLRTMLIPVVVGLVLYRYASTLQTKLPLVAIFLLINGLIIYLPQFFPTSNRDARTLTPIEGLLMGLGGGVSVLPGISAIGASTAIGSVCGVEKNYCLNMALLMNMGITLGMVIYDIMAIFAAGVGALTLAVLLRCLLTGLIACGSAILAIQLMRYLAAHHSFSLFGLYSLGLAMFTFILNLIV